MSDARGTYPPISSYAFLSDTHTAALVGPDGAVEWLCVPRFDGESVFARILDRESGGAFELEVVGADAPARRYVGDTLVLESIWRCPTGEVVVTDFLAVAERAQDGGQELAAEHALVRIATCRTGSARLRARIDARPGYATTRSRWRRDAPGRWCADDPDLWVSSTAELTSDGGELTVELDLAEGDSFAIAFGYGGEPVDDLDPGAANDLMADSVDAWQRWSDRCSYDGVAREAVLRSALVLRGLAFDETGALLAAPTTSLPEEIGGERNWDYRYTWHRDASLLILALFRLGHQAEGRRYLRFLLSQCAVQHDRLAPMAGIGGELESRERTLEHLDGYAGSRPVRIGNEAYEQSQLDTYGHVLDAAYVFHTVTGELSAEDWHVLRRLVELVADHWHAPDHGIWETRGEERHYTNSKMLAWTCLDRGIRLAELQRDDEAPVERWMRIRDEVHADVLERGYDEERGAFVQVYGERQLDAAALHAVLMGFLPGSDFRVVGTIDRLIDELGTGDVLLHRYDTRVVDDGVSGHEGAFLMSSFDLVSALALAGRPEEAERRFRRLLEYGGPLGLFSEEVSSDGQALGNYPQAFTHLALIQAAMNLDTAGDREALHDWASRSHG